MTIEERIQMGAREFARNRLINQIDWYKSHREHQLQLWDIDPTLPSEKLVIELQSRIEKARKASRQLLFPLNRDLLIIALRVESGEGFPELERTN